MQKRLKVLLYSHYFYPALGGLETVSLTLAEGFTGKGIDCKVVTISKSNGSREFPFQVIRNPGNKEQIQLVKWADVVLFNGASLALQPWVLLYGKPFVWVHVGYQVSCIDGLGWVNGVQAPIEPFKSFIYHTKQKGLGWGIKQAVKLCLRRFFAKYLVTKNIAITNWMSTMQPLPRQVHIYNPFPINQFLASSNDRPEYDFIYLGRIVSEKGISTLLKAFAIVIEKNVEPAKLLMIGDGQWMNRMQQLAKDLNIDQYINFAGKKSGKELVDGVATGRIAIIPSEWYEPMGGVALELMAADKNLIVSESGGLKECVGDVGLTFPNGNHEALADCMMKLLNDTSLQNEFKLKGRERIKLFDPSIFISQYVDLLKEIT